MAETISQAETGVVTDASFRRRRWYHRRDVRFVGVIVALLVVYHGYGYISGPDKITPTLADAMDQSADRVNIDVRAKFPPEAFHLGVFQKAGVVRGSKGNITTLFRVKKSDVYSLSRKYWIVAIDLAPPVER